MKVKISPRWLTAAIAGAFALASAGVLPGHGTRAEAAAPVSPVQHLVVLMQENHSLDSELGYWCNASPGRCPAGGMPASVTLSDGTVVTPGVTPDVVPPVDHSVASQTAAIDSGKMDGWQNISGCSAATGYACIGGYTPAAIPNLAALATAFGVEDAAFTQADSPSWGGHLNELAATTDGFTGDNPYPDKTMPPGNRDWGCDSNMLAKFLPVAGHNTGPQPSCVPDPALNPVLYPNGGAYKPTLAQYAPTILQEMDAAGVPWNIYAAKPADSGGAFWSGCPSFASCLDTAEFSHVFESGQFFADATSGNLPAVSFLMPEGKNGRQFDGAFSQHNKQSNAAGDNWIGRVASALMNGPGWASTALIITYDDCGCFYDQVPPPAGPDGRQEGPRVPFIVVSPYAKAGYTDSTPTTSTGSILAFIEWNWGLLPLNASDAAAYNLTGMFSFAQQPRRGPRMVWRHLPARDYVLAPSTARDPT